VLPSRGIAVPTHVIRGQGDRYLGRRLTQPEHNDVRNLDRVTASCG
jgi:hypothetical protein